MMKRNPLKSTSALLAATLLLIMMSAGNAHAILILNESFESPSPIPGTQRGDGNYDTDPTSWVAAGHPSYTGLGHESNGRFSTPYGSQAAWVYYNGGSLTQTVSDVLTAGMKYDLEVNVAKMSSTTVQHAEYILQLLAGNVVLTEVRGKTFLSDMSEAALLSYTPADADAQLGQALGVRLLRGLSSEAVAGAHFSINPYFDNVQLTATLAAGPTVPEPATASLALLGLGGLMLRRRRMA